jgi:hypothetical protein
MSRFEMFMAASQLVQLMWIGVLLIQGRDIRERLEKDDK